jgi:hypothetical protein
MNDTQKSKWSVLIKVLIAIASALLGILGGAETSALLS